MRKLSELVEEHFQENNLKYDRRECGNADSGYVIPYGGRNVGMHCGVEVHEDQRRLGISIFSGVKAARERLPMTYEFAARANSVLAIGAFCVNPDGGEVSFDIGASLLDVDANDMWLGSLICTGLHTYDKYFPAIAGILYAGMEPAEAMAKVDGPSDEDVADSISKLLGDAGEIPEQPAMEEDQLDETRGLWDERGESDEQEDREDEESSDSPEVSVRLPKLPRIIAHVAPQEMEDVLREIRGEARHNPEDEGQAGGQNEAVA